jgi:hypothetical protein
MKAGAAIAAILLAGGLWAAEPPAPSCGLVPGWTQHGEPRTYTAENLFEYMDGNAEGYLIYGFRKMLGVTCKQGETTLVIDVSDFGDPDSAYGMLTATRDARQPSAAIGMGGQIVPRRALFAKGGTYVEIAANPEGDYSPALRAWTAALEKTVEGRTTVPDALSWFPTGGQQGLRLIPESVLGIRVLKKGYVAQYGYGKAFVVLEASPESAATVMQKLRARFGATTAVTLGSEALQFTDKYLGKLCIFREGRYVGGWANVAEGQDAVALARTLAAKLK